LGLKTTALVRLGNDDNGRRVLKNLKDNKVDTAWIKIDPKAGTAFSVVITVDNEAKEHIAFIHRGANALLTESDLPLSKIDADWFYVTSLPKFGWEDIMAKLAKTKKNIVWNPGKEQLRQLAKLKKHLKGIKVFLVNRDEALEFKKLKDVKGLLKYIKDLGPEQVVITDGKNGAYVFDGKKYYFMKALSAKAVNTLGVGDAFGSALTAALVYGKNIKQALAWGMKNSASVVSQIGAQKGILTLRQIKK
jgi:sugar/nucleoside kinase (ribokinase family)